MVAIKVGGLNPNVPVGQEAEKVKAHLLTSVEGSPLDSLDRIAEFSDLNKIRKVYKLPNVEKGNQNAQEQDNEERREMEAVMLGLMALRGA